MPGPRRKLIELTTRQREILERLARRETNPQRLIRRCLELQIARAPGSEPGVFAHQDHHAELDPQPQLERRARPVGLTTNEPRFPLISAPLPAT